MARQIIDGKAPNVPIEAAKIVGILSQHALDTHIRLREIDRDLLVWLRGNDVARRLTTIPGFGPVGATALAATVTNPQSPLLKRHGHAASEAVSSPRQARRRRAARFQLEQKASKRDGLSVRCNSTARWLSLTQRKEQSQCRPSSSLLRPFLQASPQHRCWRRR